ncbi:MAG TPA: hypothetical protein VMW73_17415 [Spirochaetia bacterium]|nr:hypothetical protein [Spirochaetia bacterium]
MSESPGFSCSLVSPLTHVRFENVTVLVVQATTGELGILAGHAPTVASLKGESTVRATMTDSVRSFRIGASSFLKFGNGEAVILTSEFGEQV